jgi:Putative Flp pilus-assembly TadE/G-like
VRGYTRSRDGRGQILVVVALAMVVIVGMAGLVLDGGAVFAQQRVAQNGSDAAATAGALVIAEKLGGATGRTNATVFAAIDAVATANDLEDWTAEYTDDSGNLLGIAVGDTASDIPATARGVRARGSRTVGTTFSRVLGFDELEASAEAIVVAGKLSGECVADEDGCALIPVTFPVQVYQCDNHGNLISPTIIGDGSPNYPIVGQEALPSGADADGDTTKLSILPLCRGSGDSSGTFGWLDLNAGMNLADEITGPLNDPVDIPDWFQTQTGNPNSVDDELSAYIHTPVLIPLYDQACRVDPGATDTCPPEYAGVDPVGNNTWYYVRTLAVFFIHEVFVQASNIDECANPPGGPLVPVTTGGGFLGCMKGWFVNYVFSGTVVPGGEITTGTAIGIQLIK